MFSPKFVLAGLVLLGTAGFSSPHIQALAPPTADVCVLLGQASEEQRREFDECVAKSECTEWHRYEDENTGNIAMICQNIEMPADRCALEGEASEEERFEFGECVAKTRCEHWKRHEEEISGGISMVCEN